MARGQKKRRQQEDLWVATSELPRTAGHPFYERLNGLFNEHGFDDFVEGLCAKFYADKMGRPSLAPGVYFRLPLVGYFEGIGSERGIAWRASDSLGLKVSESPSDHSTISRTRRLIDVATHEAVFDWVTEADRGERPGPHGRDGERTGVLPHAWLGGRELAIRMTFSGAGWQTLNM